MAIYLSRSKFHKLTDDLNLVVEHFLGEAGVEVKILKVECWMLDSMAEARVFMGIFIKGVGQKE
jgi:hypothetical protein